MNYQQHMQANGIENPPSVIQDGRIHRFKTKKNKKNGWYIAYQNPEIIVYGDWTEPDIKHVYRSDGGTQLSAAERQAIEAKRNEAKLKADARKVRNAKRLERFFNACQPLTTHQYINAKQVTGYNLKEYRSNKRHLLLIPMKNTDRQITGMQLIYPNGFKRYARGSQTKAVYFGIGTPDDVIYIAEGYATAATIHAVTGKAVAVAFSTGNLLDITGYMKQCFTGAKVIVACDNDRWSSVNTVKGKQDNPGLYYGKRAAELTGCNYRLPQFTNLDSKPTDFNDLYVAEGEQPVRLYLETLTHNDTVVTTSEEQIEYNTFEMDEPKQETTQPVNNTPFNHDSQFRFLGFDNDNYFFLPVRTNLVISLTRSALGSKTNLLGLASLDWWQEVFFHGEKEDWTYAADFLMRFSEQQGKFNPENIRGRGAWFDNGRSVLHIGNKLIVDGVLMNIHEFKTKFIYELAVSTESDFSTTPATVEQATEVFELFSKVNFDRKINAHFLAGWCFLAPICSALDWRPHIWLTGARGTGKSWVQENIVNPLLGNGALKTQGSTTEAGIRQSLKLDGRPVLFDEAESEDQQGRRRMQSVLELARQASSNSSAGITKGTAGGDAMTFFVRSMFMFGSINVAIKQAADESRITVLSINKHAKTKQNTDDFHEFQKDVNNVLTDERTSAIRARAYKMIPVLRHNAKIIARAIAEKLGSQRTGDQYGALLAGAYAYKFDDELTIDQARKFVADIDFTEAQEAEDVKDEERLINTILQAQIRVEVDGFNYNRSIAEFIQIAIGSVGDNKMHSIDATKALERHGLKIDGEHLLIANNHSALQSILNDTAWGSGWARVLIRLDGAVKPKTPVRFNGILSRSISVPIGVIFG